MIKITYLDHFSKGSLWLWLGSLDLDLLDDMRSLDLDLRNIGSLDLDRSDLEGSLKRPPLDDD